jgi:glycerol-3-phosphate dehydrogenase (NAD(P)+)
MKITILSDGGWGTAVGLLLLTNGHDVTIWGAFPDHIEEMRRTRRNDRFLKGPALPADLELTADIEDAVADADMLVLATPTQYARGTLERLQAAGGPGDRPLVNLAKGIEVGTLLRLSELCEDVLDSCSYAVLSGPSHAEEVARRVPTAVVVAADDAERAERVQQAFMNDVFRVYTTDDVTGVELGGSLKNVFAIAAGICDGMQLGDNTKAALLTRGIAEMARLGVALGGRADTFSGLSGIGDMIVTCMSGHSRNRHVGDELGKGRTLDEIVTDMGMVVAEGVKTTESAHELARRHDIDTPITDAMYAVIYREEDPREILHRLMTREARPERDVDRRTQPAGR